MQEIVLGVGGWRALEALGHEVDVCHLNEGHAALATLERARSFAERSGCDFFTALWATRGGNVFTTHTPVAAAFDTFPLRAGAEVRRRLRAALRHPARAAARARARQPGRSRRAVQHGLPRGAHLRARQRRERAARPREPRHLRAAVPALAGGRGAGHARHQRACTCRPGTRPGPTASGPRPAARSAGSAPHERLPRRRGAAHRRAAVGLPRHGAPRPRGLRAPAPAAPAQPARRGASESVGARARGARPERADARLRAALHGVQAARRCCSRSPSAWRGCCRDPARPVQLIIAGKAHPRDELGRSVRAPVGRVRAPARRARRAPCSSRTTTWRSPSNSCRASTCGSTRRAGPGRRAARAA